MEDVELLERGIFGRKRLLSLDACQSVTEVTVQFQRSLAFPVFAVPTELFFFFRQVSSFYGVICLQFLTSDTPIPLISINAQSQTHATLEQTPYMTF